VYTPLHGVGKQLCVEALTRLGFSDLHIVEEQAEPNGEFPTVRSPNPEDLAALSSAITLASKVDADLILANDPDADRLAVSLRNKENGTFVHLSGNQVGVLFAQYFLEQERYRTPNSLYMCSIVSSPMLQKMAEKNHVMFEKVLTGFKWIGTKAIELENAKKAQFVFGYEEAIGYSVGPLIRDKDGISAAVMFSELAAFYKTQGISVAEKLELIYREYGLYVSSQFNITRSGVAGAKEISHIMSSLRKNPPTTVGTARVATVSDYESSKKFLADGSLTPIPLPSSNVLAFELEDGSRIMARPSGTEPKMKFYFDVCEPMTARESFASAQERANKKLGDMRQAFLAARGLL
jgi:phosphomannomutase